MIPVLILRPANNNNEKYLVWKIIGVFGSCDIIEFDKTSKDCDYVSLVAWWINQAEVTCTLYKIVDYINVIL